MFAQWIETRIAQIEQRSFAGRETVLDRLHTALQYWQERTAKANAD
jgi:hypothetical protein